MASSGIGSDGVDGSRSSWRHGFVRLTGSRTVPIAHFVLDVAVLGPAIGFLNGRPIAATVVDRSGCSYVYAGLAPRHRDGRLDVEALGPNEWIVVPGLVYRLEGSTAVVR
jgi:hypothetical protein